MRASRQEPEPGPARGGPRQPRRASGSQRARRWKNNTAARLYPQGPQGHSKEETAPEKVKVEHLQESCQNQEAEQKGGKAKGGGV